MIVQDSQAAARPMIIFYLGPLDGMIGSGVKRLMTNETANETTNEETGSKPAEMTQEKWNELIKAVHHNGMVALKMYFKDVKSQILNLAAFGPVFVYHVKNESGDVYSTGFFLREMVGRFQADKNPEVWVSSFFHELMKTKGGQPLPKQPESEEEAKAVIDNSVIPLCIKTVQEEFAPEKVHAGLAWNEAHGPVFEAGFPAITDGNNVCAIPLQLLYTHYQLNRDPSELLLQGMYNIRKVHGLE